jgi:hypothetical protein
LAIIIILYNEWNKHQWKGCFHGSAIGDDDNDCDNTSTKL